MQSVAAVVPREFRPKKGSAHGSYATKTTEIGESLESNFSIVKVELEREGMSDSNGGYKLTITVFMSPGGDILIWRFTEKGQEAETL